MTAPHPSNNVPKYCQHRSSARMFVDGQEIPLGRFGSPESRERYDRIISDYLANGRQLPTARPTSMDVTISELIVAYLEFARREYSRPGSREYANLKPPLRVLRRLYGSTPAALFRPKDLKDVRKAMISRHLEPPPPDGRRHRPLSRGYVNDSINRLRRMFRWAVGEDLIPADLAQRVDAKTVPGLKVGKGGRETEEVVSVPEAYIEAIEPYTSRQVWGLVQLQNWTGMRPSEAIALRACDINMRGKIWEIRPTRHKTAHFGIKRRILIGPEGQEVIRRFLSTDLQAYLFSPRDAQAERFAAMRRRRKTPVQPSQLSRKKMKPRRAPAEHYTVDSYRKAIHRACDHADRAARGAPLSPRLAAADADQLTLFDVSTEPYEVPEDLRKVPRWNPGQLRHNFATRIEREYGEKASQILCGHTNPKTTRIYIDADWLAAGEAITKLG